MAPLSRLERLRVAALRLRNIQHEVAAIYRHFPELDRRPSRRISARRRLTATAEQQGRAIFTAAKLH